MEPTLMDILQARRGDDWLVGPGSAAFWPWLDRLTAAMADGAVLIAEPDPVRFLAAYLAVGMGDRPVVLANPRWGKAERHQLQALVHPNWDSPYVPDLAAYPCQVPEAQPGQILIPTGGSSGQIKFAVHTEETLMASVAGFCAHFGVSQVHAYCVLPLFHVSGLMQALRVLASGGTLALQPYGDLNRGELLPLPPGGFLSLVPTQLHDLLERGEGVIPWLRSFRAVLLGGAPAGQSLLDQAQALGIPIALTYGMTETAAQVATLLPQEFLAGHRSSGRALPHAKITVLSDRGQPQPLGQPGSIVIQAESLAQGYWQGDGGSMVGTTHHALETDDIGYLDDGGYLHIVGRSSTKIITGGENVFPEEVEAALLATGAVSDACVVGLGCDRWGQQLCALVVLAPGQCLESLPARLRPHLAPHKIPKQWVALAALPRTPQGKLRRPAACTLAQRLITPNPKSKIQNPTAPSE